MDFSELYNRFFDRIYDFTVFHISDLDMAEDLVQETFLAAHRLLSKGRDLEYPYTWLIRTSRNKIKALYRSRRYQRQKLERLGTQGRISDIQDPGLTAVEKEKDQALTRALDSLEEPLSSIVFLLDIQGLSYREAGEILNMPERTMRRKKDQAWIKLKELLDRENINSPA